jgi:tellurite resistance protein TerC
MENPVLWWTLFNVFLLAMLALDLGIFHRKSHSVGMKEALTWSAVWIALALGFNAWLYVQRGPQVGLEFLTGYLIEKSLSVDNVFVFLLLFTYFRVPSSYQHKVLFWGILGALVMRAIFIFAGVALLDKFHWMIYVFGAVLILSGIKMALEKDKEVHPERNPVLKLFRRMMPITPTWVGDRFFTRQAGRLAATPLFVTLLLVETTDVIFAVDSIPAILAITRDPFIVYTSNAFAILGLRALYFALAGVMGLFHHLHYGLSAILVFVGIKMCVVDVWKVPTLLSLGVVAALIAASVAASLLWPKKAPAQTPAGTHGLAG